MKDVAWGELDYFIVDMPPGTGDAQLSLVQATQVTGAIIVTTPQEVSVGDALRGVKMFERVSVPVLGIVENMSWLECPHCGKPSPIFGSGGGERLANEVGLPLLGQIPLYPPRDVGRRSGCADRRRRRAVVGGACARRDRRSRRRAHRRQRPAADRLAVLDPTRATSLPVETHEGIAPVAVTGDWQAARTSFPIRSARRSFASRCRRSRRRC